MRIRKIVSGTQAQPRMTVYRSNKQIYVQFIDDLAGTTLAAASSLDKEVAEAAAGKNKRWSENWPRSVPSKRVSRPWRSTATDICITDELKC
mgnify:CR=1 FL=1